METIRLGEFYTDCMESNSKKILMVAGQIESLLSNPDYDSIDGDITVLFGNIRNVLDFWTGNTYVGHKKEKLYEGSYQTFFEKLFIFLMNCKDIKCEKHNLLVQLHDTALYRGRLYRYLGHDISDRRKCRKKVEPEYNDIFVSWSKNPDNSYLVSKLYGTITKVTCNVEAPYYGIDLEAFGVSRANEAEVVFPTTKETIVDVKFFFR